MPGHIFISHATKDDPFVKELRVALESLNLPVWVDSRNLRGGDKLAVEINSAIENARQVIVVLSPNTVNSPWVRKEISKALAIEKARQAQGFRVIPLMLPDIEPAALTLWFDEEPLGIRVQLTAGGIAEALPQILAALGEKLPEDYQPTKKIDAAPVEELVLKLVDPKIELHDGKQRATATATLVYEPADKASRAVESKRYTFSAPLGPIEAEDLRWYLESYYLWPTGVFQQRAERIEAQLPQWGRDLYHAALRDPIAAEALQAWRKKADGAQRRFSVLVDSDPPAGADDDTRKATLAAASNVLSLPWELLHDGAGYLFRGKNAVAVRRRLPNRAPQEVRPTSLPIRILLVSPRPEDKTTGYIDHRVSAKPLVEAVAALGDLAALTVLTPPTLAALRQELKRASEANQPYDVVHFDGHGVYDREHGLGALCFEDPQDADKLHHRSMQLVHASELASDLRDYRIPVVFLEACQSATVETDPTASVAAKLLECGVAAVVAMSHSVLVETARRFVEAFYGKLAGGSRVAEAMLAGQNALEGDKWRGKVMGAGDLKLHDWFVPVLYQEEQDPQLVTSLPAEAVQRLQERRQQLRFGNLPETPSHKFHGRSRQLLALERLLHTQNYAVVRGTGGAGKTTLAAELGRWLVSSKRFGHAAFVSLETVSDVRAVLDSLGRQLLPEGANYSVAQYRNLDEALQPVERALQDSPTIMVLDNLESILPDANGIAPAAAAPVDELFALCRKLLASHPATRIVFTTREALPAPFDHKARESVLGPLDRNEAVELVSSVMKQEGLEPKASDPGSTPQEIIDLVEAVNCHARALVLLGREVARQGVRSTTANLQRLMAELEQKHPGQRENSLYASVELSLRRLPADMREQIKPLGLFHGGANTFTIMQTLEVDQQSAKRIAHGLVDVGLGQMMNYGHLRLDPALAPYLLGQMNEAEQAQARQRWATGMRQLLGYLYKERFKNTELSATLTLLELPNLLALLDWAAENLTPEEVVDITSSLETLLHHFGRPQALARVVAVREQAAKKLGDWSHARFEAERARIERLLESGDVQAAYTAAQQLVQNCLNAGEQAYAGAGYDIAVAHFLLGRVLVTGGAAEAALSPLAEAQKRFQQLADAGNTDAARMASAAITESGDCLRNLGRLEEAAAAYEKALELDKKRGDLRDIAAGKFQLGTVRMLQKKYAEALKIYAEARDIFENLGEPGSVATAWHQIGMVHKEAGQYDRAEQAYRQSLAIKVARKNRAGEAGSVNELGNLYGDMGRLEEAVIFYRQAADIYAALPDNANEGRARYNIANTLIKLRRYDEARSELLRAIECDKPYGHAAEPWKTFMVLHNLEQATGNPQAAASARQQAIAKYLAYRRAGGGEHERSAQICGAVAQAIGAGQAVAIQQALAQIAGARETSASDRLFISKLQAILSGDRNPALASDPNLYYQAAAELQLLLEKLR
ncbi:tetratricopeptide repeat protein [candidate division KSB1 bacterium]|nr:tetratricopeptide repeat protein [bacterium]NUM64745.1 tetratricopeptide repeat protein [candidate division KSB1 bacterium]